MGIKVFGVVYMLYCNYICKDEYEDGVIQDFEFKGFVLVFLLSIYFFFFFFQAEDGIRDKLVTGVQTCALPISTLVPHGVNISTPGLQPASLDHAVWFHQPFRADEWWLYDQHSPSASGARGLRSEEHTSELQSLAYLVCRLLLEKKKLVSALSLS